MNEKATAGQLEQQNTSSQTVCQYPNQKISESHGRTALRNTCRGWSWAKTRSGREIAYFYGWGSLYSGRRTVPAGLLSNPCSANLLDISLCCHLALYEAL